MSELKIPRANGAQENYRLTGTPIQVVKYPPAKSRVGYAAAHVVVDPLADVDPSSSTSLDWESTLAFRRYLWDLGFCVAEGMDTAQRGMGLDYATTRKLIAKSVAEARACDGRIACGAGTDQLEITPNITIEDIIRAYAEQCDFIEGVGGRIILMASRALAAVAKGPEDYAHVYDAILGQVAEPVIIHWLGDMFDPALRGYWGYDQVLKAMDACLHVIHHHAARVDGIKISLLDPDLEVHMRRRLPESVKMYTGDDFHYPELIAGDDEGYSHALLGIFDVIAPVAAQALHALDAGETLRFHQLLDPTVPLSRHIFQAPTRFYKTGVVFTAYLNGRQSHFKMVGGMESMRSIVHLSELFILADQAGLLADPDLAVERMKLLLATAGVV